MKDGFISGCALIIGELNKLTVKNHYPLLRIDDVICQHQGVECLLEIDLRIGLSSTESSKQEHEEHLKLILELLKKEELYAKFSKCEFWIPKVQFSSHVIDNCDMVGLKENMHGVNHLMKAHDGGELKARSG
ncbi:hypothetical protein Tco_1418356 [Tanacetum coccineum]